MAEDPKDKEDIPKEEKEEGTSTVVPRASSPTAFTSLQTFQGGIVIHKSGTMPSNPEEAQIHWHELNKQLDIYDGDAWQTVYPAEGGEGGGISGISIRDEGTLKSSSISTINFVGAAVAATVNGTTATVTITASGGSAVEVLDEGESLGNATSINFVGDNVTAAAEGSAVTVTIAPPESSAVEVLDEGESLGNASSLDFVGEGVTATIEAGAVTVTIPYPVLAGVSTPGLTELSTAPADADHPISVGDNDVRMSATTEEQIGLFSSVQKLKLDTIDAGAEVNNISDENATALVTSLNTSPTSGQKEALAGSYGIVGAANKYVTSTDPRVLTEAQVSYVPTSDQKAALVGSYGTPGAGNKYVTSTDTTLLPTSGQKAALVGTSGTPGSGNKYVTDVDTRVHTPNTDTNTNANTFSVGNGSAGTKTLLFNTADTDKPGYRFNDSSDVCQFSNDGLVWKDVAEAGAPAEGNVVDNLVPEYTGAVIYFDGSGNNDAGSLGLTSGFDATNFHNFYSWMSDDTGVNYVELIVRFRIPADFSSWNYIKFFNKVIQGTGNAAYHTVRLYGTDNVEVTLTGGANLQNTSWAQTSMTVGSGTFTAGGFITLRLKLATGQNDEALAGEIVLDFNYA